MKPFVSNNLLTLASSKIQQNPRITRLRGATADYSNEEMHASLDVNIPNYASAIVDTAEVADALALASH